MWYKVSNYPNRHGEVHSLVTNCESGEEAVGECEELGYSADIVHQYSNLEEAQKG